MPTVGLSMIVKNAERDIAFCINSVKSVVDQIVVADTGSTDRTKEIAEQLGAEVYSIPWENDFSKARNAAIDRMKTDWILVLDADEELSKEAAAKLLSLLQCDASIGGYMFLQRNYQDSLQKQITDLTRHPMTDRNVARAEKAQYYVDMPNCRLFRRHPQIYYNNRIHEELDNQILASGMRLELTDLCLHHFGFLIDSVSRRKKEYRYLKLLKQAVAEEPNDYLNWLQLGMMLETLPCDAKGAMQCYRKSNEISPSIQSWICLANLHLCLSQHQEAIEMASHIPIKGSYGLARCTVIGDAMHGLGRLDEAQRAYTDALALIRANPKINGTDSNLLIENRLGYTEVRLGMADAGLKKLQRSVAAAPEVMENRDRLVRAFMLLERHTDAAEAAEAAIPYAQNESVFSRAAALRMHAGGKAQAQKILDDGVKRFPNSKKLQELRASIP